MQEKLGIPTYFICCAALVLLLSAFFYILAHSTLVTDFCTTDRLITDSCEKINKIIYGDKKISQIKLRELSADIMYEVEKKSLWKNIFNHLSTAFLVSLILMLIVELYMRRKAYEETGRDVLEYVLKKEVPPIIFNEVRDNILNSPVIRKETRYEFKFSKNRYNDLPSNMIMIERKTIYEIHNLTSRRIIHPLRASLFLYPSAEVAGGTVELPRFVELRINGETVKPLETEIDRGSIVLKHPVSLKKSGSATILLLSEELVWNCDTGVWFSVTMGENLYIHITELPPDLLIRDVELIHPSSSEFKSPRENFWEFKGGILPGQSFKMSWELVGKSDP
jgi:hypothetical protein